MGVAAYNRGSAVIAEQIARDYPMKSQEVQIIERINSLPKYMDDRNRLMETIGVRTKHQPFFDVGVAYSDLGGWMFGDYNDPFGFVRFYKSLDDVVRSWDIYLIDFRVVQGRAMWITINHDCLDNSQEIIDRLN